MNKTLAIVGLTAGLTAGGAAGFAFTGGSPFASAESAATTTIAAPAGQAPSAQAPSQRPDPSVRLHAALKGLVDDGTITQAQADKVVDTLIKAGPMGGHHDGGPEGGQPGGPGGRHGRPGLRTAATALGMSPADLRTSLQSGKSIAAVATEKGVDVNKVIDALVGEAKTRLDNAVKSGKMTQAEADQRLTSITQRITARVNGQQPQGGPGADGPAPADAPAGAPADGPQGGN